MNINETEYATLLRGRIVKADWAPDINRQTLHLEDGCMIQIEDGKMRLFNSGGAMLLPGKPKPGKLVITEEVLISYEFEISELPQEIQTALTNPIGEADEAEVKDWFCNLDSGDVEDSKLCEQVDKRTVEVRP